MAYLDNEDLKAIKEVLVTSLDEVFERKDLAMKESVNRLMTRNDLNKKVAEIKEISSTPLQ